MKLQHKIATIASLTMITCASSHAETVFSAGVGLMHDSNVLRQVAEESDTAAWVRPGIDFTGQSGANTYRLQYDGEFRQYADNDDFNFNVHDFKLNAGLRHTQRFSSSFEAQYYNGVERPGLTDQSTAGFTEFTDFEWRRVKASGIYGSKVSSGQIVVSYENNARRFENNNQEFRDGDEDVIKGQFFYRSNKTTRVLVETSYSDLEYKDKEANQSSSERISLLVGLEWELGTSTTGVAKIGYQDRSFDNPVFEDTSDLAYSVDMIWAPTTFTTVTAGVSREIAAAAQANVGELLRNGFKANVDYAFSDRTLFEADYEFIQDDIAETRTDNRQRIGVGVDHFLQRWLTISARYFYEERTSDIDAFEFNANSVQLNLVMTFD